MSDAEFVYGINPAFELMKAKRRQILRIFLSESAKSNPRIVKIAELCNKRQIPMEWQ